MQATGRLRFSPRTFLPQEGPEKWSDWLDMGLASQMLDDWVQQQVVLDNITSANLLAENVGELTAAHCSVWKSIILMPCLEDIGVSIKGTHGQKGSHQGFSQMLHVIGNDWDIRQPRCKRVDGDWGIPVGVHSCNAKTQGALAGTSGRIRRSLLFRPNGYQRAYQWVVHHPKGKTFDFQEIARLASSVNSCSFSGFRYETQTTKKKWYERGSRYIYIYTPSTTKA